MLHKLEALIGIEEATTPMEHLLPVGWADVATKSDLGQHQALARTDLDRATADLRHEISQVRTDLELTMEQGFREQTRTMVLTNVGSMAAFAAVLIAAVRNLTLWG